MIRLANCSVPYTPLGTSTKYVPRYVKPNIDANTRSGYAISNRCLPYVTVSTNQMARRKLSSSFTPL